MQAQLTALMKMNPLHFGLSPRLQPPTPGEAGLSDTSDSVAKTRLAALESEVSTMKNELYGLSGSDAQTRYAWLELEIGPIRQGLSALQGEFAGLESEVATMRDDLPALRDGITQSSLQSQISTLKDELAALRGSVDPTQSQFRLIYDLYTSLENTIARVFGSSETRLGVLTASLDSKIQSLETGLSALAASMDSKIQPLQTSIDNLAKDETHSLELRVDDLEATLQMIKTSTTVKSTPVIECGEWHTPWDWTEPQSHGQQRIRFSKGFSRTPKVIVSTKRIDTDRMHNTRVHLYVTEPDMLGFTVHAETWSGSILYGCSVSWVAVGENED